MVLASFSIAGAQNPRGALRGEVQDASGARVAGAQVSAKSKGSSQLSVVDTDHNGEFRLEGLQPGTYQLTVHANGFASATASMSLGDAQFISRKRARMTPSLMLIDRPSG